MDECKNPLDLGPSGLFNKLTPMVINDPLVDMLLLIIAVPYSFIKAVKQTGIKLADVFGNPEAIRAQLPESKPL